MEESQFTYRGTTKFSLTGSIDRYSAFGPAMREFFLVFTAAINREKNRHILIDKPLQKIVSLARQLL